MQKRSSTSPKGRRSALEGRFFSWLIALHPLALRTPLALGPPVGGWRVDQGLTPLSLAQLPGFNNVYSPDLPVKYSISNEGCASLKIRDIIVKDGTISKWDTEVTCGPNLRILNVDIKFSGQIYGLKNLSSG